MGVIVYLKSYLAFKLDYNDPLGRNNLGRFTSKIFLLIQGGYPCSTTSGSCSLLRLQHPRSGNRRVLLDDILFIGIMPF